MSFNFALALLTGVLFGLIPAVQFSRTRINDVLKDIGAASVRVRRGKIRGTFSPLVTIEIAVSVILLVAAGLMIKSLARLQAVDLGFDPDGIVTMSAPSRDAKPEFYQRLLSRVQTLPGVESASFGSTAPLLGYSSATVMDIEGRADRGPVGVGFHSVSPDYFETLRISLIKGRTFTRQDRAGAPRVAIINQAAADALFQGEEVLGKRIKPYIDPEYDSSEKFVEIVGVVANARYGRLEEPVGPDIYLSSLQPTDLTPTLILRTHADVSAVAAAVRGEVLALDSNVPLTSIRTMKERAAEVTSRTRFIAVVLVFFAGLAVSLSAIGIYGVMSYGVSARTRDLGIRMALGAKTADVLGLVLVDGVVMIACGLAIGLLSAWVLLRVLESQLFQMSSTDPLTFMVGALLLACVALLACLLPARRAARVDPMIALRHE
jgi:putative ABC transport system permease protein